MGRSEQESPRCTTMTTPNVNTGRPRNAHPGMILLFRAGGLYELFYEDAELVSRLPGITLTTATARRRWPGFPTTPWKRRLHRGAWVAICDQVEDAAQAKGRLIRREVTRVGHAWHPDRR